MVDVLAELKPGRNLYANVEFYAGVVMDHCGLPPEMFTPTFASSRVIGWCANILEQAADNRIIRPSARYVGPPPPQPVPDPTEPAGGRLRRGGHRGDAELVDAFERPHAPAVETPPPSAERAGGDRRVAGHGPAPGPLGAPGQGRGRRSSAR